MSFEQAINDAIGDGTVAGRTNTELRTETADMGMPTVSLDRALQVAAELEDEELVRKMRPGR